MFTGERGGGEGDRFRSEAEYRGRQIDSLYSNVQSVRVREEPKPSDALMLRSINFHGQQLGSFMKEASRTLDLKNVDYQLYHQVCLKGTVSVTLKFVCKDGNARFTTVPFKLKAVFGHIEISYQCLNL